LRRGGLRDTSFISANGAGTVAAAMLDSETPGMVAVMRAAGDSWGLDARQGNLLKGTAPLLGGVGDEAGDLVVIEDLTTATSFVSPLRVTARDAGITEGAALEAACCGWWEHTSWRVPALRTDHLLVRAVVSPLSTWSVLDAYVPGRAQPRWRVRLRDQDGPARIVDVQLTPAGDRVLVQVTDRSSRSQLVAYAEATGAELWRTHTAATVRRTGALVVTDDGSSVVSILADPGTCETSETAQIYDVATGQLLRDLPLHDADILSRRGTRGYERMLGVTNDRLWFRYVSKGGDTHSMKATACTYESWSLHDGSRREADAELMETLRDCDAPMRMAPVRGGAIGLRAIDADRVEIVELRRAP
jgi:hypothetical protein